MAIGVEGQWYFAGSLNGMEDFFTYDNFAFFEIVEEAGNLLPTFRIAFYLDKSALANSVVNEGAELLFRMGRDYLSSDDAFISSRLRPVRPLGSYDGQGQGKDRFLVYLKGIYDGASYFSHLMRAFPSATSQQVIASVAANDGVFTSFESNVPNTADAQLWIQHNISTKNFLTNVWLHSYTGSNNFQCIGITTSGKFKFVNVPLLAQQQPMWNLVQSINGGGEEVIGPPAPTSSRNFGISPELLLQPLPTSVTAKDREESKYLDSSNRLLSSLDTLQITNPTAFRDQSLKIVRTGIIRVQPDPESYLRSGLRGQILSTFLPYLSRNEVTQSYYDGISDNANGMMQSAAALTVLKGAASATTLGELLGSIQTANSNTGELITFSDFAVVSRSGFLNLYSANERTKPNYRLEDNEFGDLKSFGPPEMSEVFNRSLSLGSVNRVFPRRITTKNQHPNYWQAEIDHVTKLAQYSSMQSSISLVDKFRPFEILQMVNLDINDLEFGSVSAHSGKWLIDKVVRTIANQKLSTTLWLRREGMNPSESLGGIA